MSSKNASDSKSDVQCPTCGRVDFSSEMGMKLHHAKSHGESIAGVVLTCEQCGDSYREAQCRDERSRFCSSRCRSDWDAEKWTGENNPRWSSEVKAPCAWCGSTISATPHRHESHERLFCNSQCHARWMSEYRVAEACPAWDGGDVELICEQCGKVYEVAEYLTEKSKYCSVECTAEARSENYSGVDAPRWDGGWVEYYGPNWRTQRERARKRDGMECRYCGMGDDEHVVEYGCKLPVHHIQPVRSFKPFDTLEDYESANRLPNLITLCIPHHREAERVAPLLPSGIIPAEAM